MSALAAIAQGHDGSTPLQADRLSQVGGFTCGWLAGNEGIGYSEHLIIDWDL